MFKAGIMIDEHVCTPQECEAVGTALALFVNVASGRMERLEPFMNVLLELPQVKLRRLKALLREMESVIYDGGKPWTVHNNRVATTGVIGYSMLQRLLRNGEAARHEIAAK